LVYEDFLFSPTKCILVRQLCISQYFLICLQRIGPSYRSGPGFCPTINATGDESEILVAAGIKKSIKVKVHIIGQFIVQTRFVCQFNIEGRVTSVNAQLLGDTIYCDHMEFIYTSRAPNLTATFAVIWGGSKPLDNPHNIHGKYSFFSRFSHF
jgi:plexin A